MGWCTTFDPDQFAAVAGGYLRSRLAENSVLLSVAEAARSRWHSRAAGRVPGSGPLFGWWEPPDGGEPRGAFLHDPAVPLLMSSHVPEMAASLAATLTKMGRTVCGVDAPVDAADAFAAAWSQRAGATVRVHRHSRVYRLARPGAAPARGTRALPGTGAWPPPEMPGSPGRLRVATAEDRRLLTRWLTAFADETAERVGAPADLAADLISYGGAVFWEVPQKSGRHRDAGHHLAIPHYRDAAASSGEPVPQPVALAALVHPVAGMVRISIVYTPPEYRRRGYAGSVAMAVGRAVLTGTLPGPAAPVEPGAPSGASGVLGAAPGHGRVSVNEVVMLVDGNRPNHWASRLGFQLVSERAVLRFGPVTGPMPGLRKTGPMPRLPTGPLPRLPRLHR